MKKNLGMETSKSLTDLLRSKTSSSNDIIALTKALVFRGVSMPGLLFEKAANLFRTKCNSLGDEKWSLIERILLAAIKLGNEPWIAYCLKTLRVQFPKSVRVQRLGALYKESCEDWEGAELVYRNMLTVSPEDVYVRKRLITCLKAQGRVSQAIGATIDQLELFSSDSELWHELTMLYASECAFSKAVGASEELLLSDPTSFYNVLVHAELVASAGDINLASKYFCKALQMRPNELRALWGLLVCLVETPKSPLLPLTRTRIERLYLKESSLEATASLAVLKKIC